jgi:acid phosphatase
MPTRTNVSPFVPSGSGFPSCRQAAFTSPLSVQPTKLPPAPSVSLLNFQAPTAIGRNRFVVIGDAGTGDKAQYDVARQMSLCRKVQPFASVLVLGDNVYPAGEPTSFYERLYQPYQDLFSQGVKFLPVLGNHDVKHGFGDLQLRYWGVPSCYNFKLGPPGADVEFFAIDTTILAPGVSGGNADNPFAAQQKAALQTAWLERALAQSTASMKVVFGHYPMYSRGAETKPGRAAVQQATRQWLAPLLTRYGVDVYMAGHEHHYERPVSINGVTYLVSGAGGKLDTLTRGGTEGNGLIKQNHFMLFEITPQGLQYRTISSQGILLDSGLIPRKNRLIYSA